MDRIDMTEATKRQMRNTELIADFMGGLAVLEILAGRAPAAMPLMGREEMLEHFAAFEAAYGPLAEDQAAGQLTGAPALSAETGETIARLGALLQLPAESPGAEAAAPEIRSLAEQCLKALRVPADSTGKR